MVVKDRFAEDIEVASPLQIQRRRAKMYMAYGWPQVIPVNAGVRLSASSSDVGGIFADRIIYLKIINRLLLLVTPTHLQLWSCSQVSSIFHFATLVSSFSFFIFFDRDLFLVIHLC